MESLSFKKYILYFKQAAGTSRGVLHQKETYFLIHENSDGKVIGECNLFRGLSHDDQPDYEDKLNQICKNFSNIDDLLSEDLKDFPSIQFGIDQIKMWRKFSHSKSFKTSFSKVEKGIPINGLIWMGGLDFMKQQIAKKLDDGFRCLKLKIAVNWEGEYQILKKLRKEFNTSDLELRVDANGGFSFKEAQTVLQQLAGLEIHSIEQPIKAGNWMQIAQLCKETPTPIALDEELIGIQRKNDLLEIINPQYIILKPALIGGFTGSEEWIKLANEKNIGWWITSALESNIGLLNLALWTASLRNAMPQGLGTGGLFKNNIPMEMEIRKDELWLNEAIDHNLFNSLDLNF